MIPFSKNLPLSNKLNFRYNRQSVDNVNYKSEDFLPFKKGVWPPAGMANLEVVEHNTISHIIEEKCGDPAECTSICTKKLECGHYCRKTCDSDHSHNREECTADCSKQLICGHYCARGCGNTNDHTVICLENNNYLCSHGTRFYGYCYNTIMECRSQCPYRCEHFKCNKLCFDECDRPPCNEPCKKVLSCSHKCSGLCGEPCPPCHQCNPDLQCPITLQNLHEFETNERSYILPECGCVFSVEALDEYFKTPRENNKHTVVRLWGCPSCSKTIYTALRYNAYIKAEVNLLDQLKIEMEQKLSRLTIVERTQINQAMNRELNPTIHDMVGGRWYVCENKHPYYIGDCGGATEVSQCPECGVRIGGLHHKVVETNKFYGEFDGTERPSWPGQPT